jgi:hypothetical protein
MKKPIEVMRQLTARINELTDPEPLDLLYAAVIADYDALTSRLDLAIELLRRVSDDGCRWWCQSKDGWICNCGFADAAAFLASLEKES